MNITIQQADRIIRSPEEMVQRVREITARIVEAEKDDDVPGHISALSELNSFIEHMCWLYGDRTRASSNS